MLQGKGKTSTNSQTTYIDYNSIKIFNAFNQALGVIPHKEHFIQYDLSRIETLSPNCITQTEKLINMMRISALKKHFKAQNFASILEEIEDGFAEHWPTFLEKMLSFGSAKITIAARKAKNQYLEQSPFSQFLHDTIGLLNRIDIELVENGMLDIHIEQMTCHLSMVDGWIQHFEDNELTNNPLHKLLLAFSQKVDSLMIESHIKCGLRQHQQGNNEQAKYHFDVAIQLHHLCTQSIKFLKKAYAQDTADISLAAHTFPIWGHAFNGQFNQAQHYVEKLIKSLHKRKMVLSNLIEPIVFYANLRQHDEPDNLQPIAFALHEALRLLQIKRVSIETIASPSQFDVFLSQTKALHDDIILLYEKQLAGLLEQLCIPYTYEDQTLIFQASTAKQAKQLAAHLSEKLALSCQVQKNNIVIKQVFSITKPKLMRIIESINTFCKPKPSIHLDAKKSEDKAPSTISDHAPDNPILFSADDIIPENNSSVPEYASIMSEDEENAMVALSENFELLDISESTTSEVRKLEVKEELSVAVKSNSASGPSDPDLEKLDSLVPCQNDYGFQHPAFRDAHIEPLFGARGIYIAYQPDSTLLTAKQSKKMDGSIENRFQDLLNTPCKAGPTNQNGFKWVANNNNVTLVGKITRLPYRLFPLEKAVNEQGETAYLFGTIKDTKHGKKSNRY